MADHDDFDGTMPTEPPTALADVEGASDGGALPAPPAPPGDPWTTPAAPVPTVTADGLVEASAYRTEDEARAAGAELVMGGIGPEVRRIDHTEPESGITVSAWQLLVTEYDLRRAQELLGIVEAAPVPMGTDDAPPKLERAPVPWLRVFLIWLAALIILPVIAFILTYTLMSR